MLRALLRALPLPNIHLGSPKAKDKQPEKKEYSWDKQRAGINPEDFMVKKLSGQTVVKEPGAVNGQQFIIEDCTDCDIFVCDYSASVTIDNCTNCRFFVGPVEDSIFVRDCKNCRFIVACKQWRIRDCADMDVLLYSLTQPIIESSKNIRFECFRYHYPALQEQFANAKLNVLTNDWSNLYDFTPGERNWTFLPKAEIKPDFLKPLPKSVSPEGTSHPSVVPVTWGNRSKPESDSCLVVFFGNHKDKVVDFCNTVSSPEGGNLVVIQIIEKDISLDILPTVESSKLKAPVIAIEVNGNDVITVLQKAISKWGSDVVYASPNLDVANEQIGKIFEQISVNIEI